MESEKVTLVLTDGVINVDKSTLKGIQHVQNTLEIDSKAQEIPLSHVGVSRNVMSKILEFYEHHNKEGHPIPQLPKPLKEKFESYVGEWDIKYIASFTTIDDLYDVITQSNYLGASGLLEMLGAYVASQIKGKSAEEITKVLKPTRAR